MNQRSVSTEPDFRGSQAVWSFILHVDRQRFVCKVATLLMASGLLLALAFSASGLDVLWRGAPFLVFAWLFDASCAGYMHRLANEGVIKGDLEKSAATVLASHSSWRKAILSIFRGICGPSATPFYLGLAVGVILIATALKKEEAIREDRSVRLPPVQVYPPYSPPLTGGQPPANTFPGSRPPVTSKNPAPRAPGDPSQRVAPKSSVVKLPGPGLPKSDKGASQAPGGTTVPKSSNGGTVPPAAPSGVPAPPPPAAPVPLQPSSGK